MRYVPRTGGLGRLGAAILALVCVAAAAIPAEAGVRAFRIADGSEDASFVSLGAASTVTRSVPDGHRGAFLIGHIVVDGGQRQIVHVRPDGRVDPAFRPHVRGGQVTAAALEGDRLALAGTFTALGGERRSGLAVIDARSGRPLAWTPVLPVRVPPGEPRELALSGSTLVYSARGLVYGWRAGAGAPAWRQAFGNGGQAAQLTTWRGAVWELGGSALQRLDPATGQARVVVKSIDHASGLQVIGGRLFTFARGVVEVGANGSVSYRLSRCGTDSGTYAATLTGNAHTLYAGADPYTIDAPVTLPGVVACPLAGGRTSFHAPKFAYDVHGPTVRALVLVGTRVLVFTRRF
jgi:hypothetical protein